MALERCRAAAGALPPRAQGIASCSRTPPPPGPGPLRPAWARRNRPFSSSHRVWSAASVSGGARGRSSARQSTVSPGVRSAEENDPWRARGEQPEPAGLGSEEQRLKRSKRVMNKLRNSRSAEGVARVAMGAKSSGLMDDICASFALSRLAKLRADRDDLCVAEALDMLKEDVLLNHQEYRPRSLATAIHALAKLGSRDEVLFGHVATRVAAKPADYNPQEISMLLWAFARAGQRNDDLMHLLGRQVVNKAEFFKPQELAGTVWAYATLGHPAPTLFMTVEQEVLDKVQFFKPQEVANVAWAYATLRQRAPDLFAALETRLLYKPAALNAVDVVMSAWAFAKAGTGSQQLFRCLETRALELLPDFRPAEVVAVLWALTTAGQLSDDLLRACGGALVDQQTSSAEEQEDIIQWLQPRELSNLLWVYGSKCPGGERLPALFLGAVEKEAGVFSGRDVCMTMWACARLGLTGSPAFEALRLRAVKCSSAGELQPQDTAMLLWALSSADTGAPELFSAAAQSLTESAASLSPRHMSMVAFAYGVQSKRGGLDKSSVTSVMEALRPHVVEQAGRFNGQGLVMVAQGYARTGHNFPDVFAAVELRVLNLEPLALTPQGLSQMVVAFASMRDPGVGLFDALVPRIIAQLDGFTGQGLANVAWAYAQVGQQSPPLFAAIGDAAALSVSCLSPMDVSTLAWAGASQAHRADTLFQAVAQFCLEHADDFKPHNRAGVLWAFSTAGYPAAAMYRRMVGSVLSSEATLEVRDLAQIVWACGHAEDDCTADTDSESTTESDGWTLREELLRRLSPLVVKTMSAHEASKVERHHVFGMLNTLEPFEESLKGPVAMLRAYKAVLESQAEAQP